MPTEAPKTRPKPESSALVSPTAVQGRQASPVADAFSATDILPQRSLTPAKGSWSSLFSSGPVRQLAKLAHDRDSSLDAVRGKVKPSASEKIDTASGSGFKFMNKEVVSKTPQNRGRKPRLDIPVDGPLATRPPLVQRFRKPTFSQIVSASPKTPERRITITGNILIQDR